MNSRVILYPLEVMHRFPRITASLALLMLAVFGFAQTPPADKPASFDATTKQAVLTKLDDILEHVAFVPGVDFGKWPAFLKERQKDLDKAETDVAFARQLNGALREFGVSHIHVRAPKAAQARKSGSSSGLGMQVRKVDAGLEVMSVYPMSSAGQAGIQVGDVIQQIDGKAATDSSALRIDPGKSIAIKVVKKEGSTQELTLESKSFSNRRPETLTWIADDAAVLKLSTFSQGYDRQNVESLVAEANKKAKFLVIDLRSNGGGAVSNLNHFLSLLMPDKTAIGTFVSRSSATEFAKEKAEPATDPVVIAAWVKRKFQTNKRSVDPFTGHIAVLINRGSASASEICCAALKESREAVVVGAKSAGAVLASTYRSLGGGFELQYPVQDYVTIKGVRLEGHPQIPDLALERKPDQPDDAAQQALDLMRKRVKEHTNAAPTGGGHRAAA